jgi:hypothetical protein
MRDACSRVRNSRRGAQPNAPASQDRATLSNGASHDLRPNQPRSGDRPLGAATHRRAGPHVDERPAVGRSGGESGPSVSREGVRASASRLGRPQARRPGSVPPGHNRCTALDRSQAGQRAHSRSLQARLVPSGSTVKRCAHACRQRGGTVRPEASMSLPPSGGADIEGLAPPAKFPDWPGLVPGPFLCRMARPQLWAEAPEPTAATAARLQTR